VTKLAVGGAPQKAGLRVGDHIIGIGGKRAEDVGELRRQLRRAVVDQSAKFRIFRGDDVIELTASYAGWEPPVKKSSSK
jgi:S1-C subfamily serine protease